MTALGSKEASLVNKFKNYLHSAFLECGTWDAVRIQCDTVMSFTTDLGTEASLGSMPPVSLTELFPHLVFDIEGQLEFEFDPALVLQQPPQPAANGQERFFKQAVVSPGILHIIHTATEDVLTSMQGHEAWQAQHKLLVNFLSARWNRERFQAKCLDLRSARTQIICVDGLSLR